MNIFGLFRFYMPFFRPARMDKPYATTLAPWRNASFKSVLLIACAMTALSACTSIEERAPAPVYNAAVESHNPVLGSYTVGQNDTIQQVAANYGTSIDDILRANGLSSAQQVKSGQRLYMPENEKLASLARNKGTQVFTQKAGGMNSGPVLVEAQPLEPMPSSAPIQSESLAPIGQEPLAPMPSQTASAAPQQNLTTASAVQPVEPAPVAPMSEPVKVASNLPPEQWSNPVTSGFRWPTKGPTLSGYGDKADGLRNDGINIGANEGAAVEASADGEVVYTGQAVDGFGNLILMKHKDNFVTAYGHLSRIDVKKGQMIRAGDIIGGVGKTGSVSAPQLHFEIRQGSKILNPSSYLKNGMSGTQTAGL
jgi:murein DD-endopeptidase MepM/ murein hydrolase activator NlpD